jgi:hypothetical protein
MPHRKFTTHTYSSKLPPKICTSNISLKEFMNIIITAISLLMTMAGAVHTVPFKLFSLGSIYKTIASYLKC